MLASTVYVENGTGMIVISKT